MDKVKRRDFLGMSLGGVAAIGGALALLPMKKTWDPLPSVISAGFTTVDISNLKENEIKIVKWRGNPVYIIKIPKDMPTNKARDVVVNGATYSIGVQVCTHLGCIPRYQADEKNFHCACHGGKFDINGVNTFGPPPTPMTIPPFKIDNTRLILGEEGQEYKKLKALA